MKAPPSQSRLPASPQFKEAGLTDHLNRLSVSLQREFTERPTKTTPVSSVLLMSPSGKVYTVTVDDTGALVTTELAS